jgi:alpha-galactosidase
MTAFRSFGGESVVASKIVLIGAGSAQFGFGTLSDIFQSEILEGSSIVLHDINPQALGHVERAAQAYIEQHQLPFALAATTSRQEALPGADFCVVSIEVGDRFALWEQDWQVPLQYGIRQVYGENGGPGGLFHSLRIIPPILEICEDVQALCPAAYVFNFSNPMSRICYTVHRRFPDLKLIGLCHEIASLQKHLPRILGTPFSNLVVKAGGLNHFSVLLEVRYRDTGRDAYPDLRRKAPAYFQNLQEIREQPWLEGIPEEEREPTPPWRKREWVERGLFKEILARFGYLPVTTDSHFGEYIQWAHDVVDHQGIIDFYTWYKQWVRTKQPKMGEPSTSERVVSIIEGILSDSGHEELAVNIPNDGLIDDLPRDTVVEVPALIGADGTHGIPLGALPRGIAGLLANQVAVHDLTAEAVLTGSREIALQALLVDPVVTSVRSAERALDTILKLQSQYLGYIH